jgi:hypothetical protein
LHHQLHNTIFKTVVVRVAAPAVVCMRTKSLFWLNSPPMALIITHPDQPSMSMYLHPQYYRTVQQMVTKTVKPES